LQVTLTGSLGKRFGLPLALLADTGVFLILYGTAVAFLAMRRQVPGAIVWLLIVGNVTWGVASVGVLLWGDVRLTLFGNGYIIMQASTVQMLAALQYFCVRQSNVGQFACAPQVSHE
jgi:hypothetical protein